MGIVLHSSVNLFTLTPPQFLPFLLLPAPPKRPLLSAPRIAGYLPKPAASIATPRKVVSATITNPLRLIDDPREKWAAFEHIYGPDRSRAEMDAELDAILPGYTAYMRARMQQMNAGKEKAS